MNSIETAVQGVQEGNGQLYEVIVEHFQQQLFRYCYRMLGCVQEAEDTVQEVFLKAFDKIGSYNQHISFSAWLYKITYNMCINIIRRRKLLKFVPFQDITLDETEGVGKNYEEMETNRELKRILSKLTYEERCIVILKNIEEKSFEEIAMILNLKPATARKRYERIRKKLRVRLFDTKGGVVNESY